MTMQINEVEAFDLRGDGTIVLKTRVKDDNNIQYAWYIYYENHLLMKSGYGTKPFMEYKIFALGKYRIKAFVMNKETKEKESTEIAVVFDKTTSPVLYNENIKKETKWFPVARKLDGNVWKFFVDGEIPQYADFAWYVYKKDNLEPIFKSRYSSVSEFLYTFSRDGIYRVKCFMRSNTGKQSVISEWFHVKSD